MARRAYGEGSIHRAHVKGCPDGGQRDAKCGCKWRATIEAGFTETGHRKRITVTGDSESEVARKRAKRDGELKRAETNSTAPDATRKTVHAWGQEWLKLREDTVRPSTYITSRNAVRRYIDPAIGRKRLIELTARDVRAVDAKARERGGEYHVKAIRSALRAMLRDAISDGYAVPKTLFEANRHKTTENKRPAREALPVPQAIAVLAQAVQTDMYARWVAGFYQGPRQGETLGLTWDEGIDMERGLITLMWQLQPLPYRDKKDRSLGFRVPHGYEARRLDGRFHLVRPKTSAGWRVAPMTEEFHTALTAHRATWQENKHALIWARPNGWPIDKADDAEAFRALQVAASVHKPDGSLYTGHEMRNTCATILTLNGADPATITAILGHSSWSTSLGYVTAQVERMRAALRGVNETFAAKAIER